MTGVDLKSSFAKGEAAFLWYSFEMVRKLLIICAAAFVLNLAWEEAHSILYVSYKGVTITNLVLFRAALFDAAVIMLFAYPFFLWESNSHSGCRSLTPTVLFVVALTLFAILLEKWALGTSRWVYSDAMPIIPFLKTGLTPTVQLGFLGYVSIRASGWLHSNHLPNKSSQVG